MSSYTLDDIRAAADKQFSDTEIKVGEDTAVFLNPMRQPKEIRKQITKMFKADEIARRVENGEPDLDVYALYRETLQLSARSARDFEILDEAFGDNPALWLTAFNLYNGTADLGEASTSAS